MKRIAGATLIILALALLLAPALLAQEEHGEFGVFADYYRFHNLANQNFWGVGGNLAFNLNKYVQVEGTMAYDFERNFTTNSTPLFGTSTNFQRTGFRILDGLFGPKIQTGVGPAKAFFTVKAGFNNFMLNNKGVASGFVNQVSNVPDGDTHFALYPGGGVEFFFGHVFGIRGEVGDEIYWQNGANHNLKIKIGPQFRW
jgi:Outer membrane protein beta-barrel domain